MTKTIIPHNDAAKPTMMAYHVVEGIRGQKGYWHPIGAAFMHRDGKGFNVDLRSLPLNFDGRIVVRDPIASDQETETVEMQQS